MTVLLVIFLSKALVAAACVGFGRATLGTMHGRASLSHAAMYAMAASHSFDVTLGIPLATELFPTLLPYVYANQVALSLALTLAPALCRLSPALALTLTRQQRRRPGRHAGHAPAHRLPG